MQNIVIVITLLPLWWHSGLEKVVERALCTVFKYGSHDKVVTVPVHLRYLCDMIFKKNRIPIISYQQPKKCTQKHSTTDAQYHGFI